MNRPEINTNTITDYNSYAEEYEKFRKPGPEILKKLVDMFSSVKGNVLSVGCGTGQYEKEINKIFKIAGLDRSIKMLKLAKKCQKFSVNGDMLNLPFSDNSFNGLYFMQSFHHVGSSFDLSPLDRITARKQVLKEAFRVLQEGYILIFQRNAAQVRAVWFWKYFPEALEKKLIIQPSVSMIFEYLQECGFQEIKAESVNDDMIEGFYDPEAPLKKSFRNAFSEFSFLSGEAVSKGMKKLKNAIKDGSVYSEIAACRKRFSEIGGSVFMISGIKI